MSAVSGSGGKTECDEELPTVNEGKIAIVGMAGRFPGAPDLDTFWHNLQQGVESIDRFSPAELAASGVPEELIQDPRYVPARGILEDLELFDHRFFGYSPAEAACMDPQHRVFLQSAWHALEDACCDPTRFPGPIGVYAGLSQNAWSLGHLHASRQLPENNLRMELGNLKDYLPTRVAYHLDLHGPAVNVQTACSTSLVAVHLACQGLLLGDCDLALAGGVALTVPARTGYLCMEESVLSPDGHCRAFDAEASGTVSGNGVGIVVLRRLEDALEAGDRIQAVILGSAINNDGRNKVGFTAPGVEGQVEVIEQAHTVAGIHPSSLAYVEAHGTGTSLGDPIEVAALTQAFERLARTTSDPGNGDSGNSPKWTDTFRNSCALGSLKTNIGHLDAAAGVAGLIKTVLALRAGEIPPSLNFRRPNPEIDFQGSPFYVADTLQPWPDLGSERRAAVSSFGLGGTNAHVVLEQAPDPRSKDLSTKEGGLRRPAWQLLPLAARSSPALLRSSQELATHLRDRKHEDQELEDVAFSLQTGRQQLRYRQIVLASSKGQAAATLDGVSQEPSTGAANTELLRRADGPVGSRPVVFLFPGGGSQYPNMGLELYQTEPVYHREIQRCAEGFAQHLDLDLCAVLFPTSGLEAAHANMQRTTAALPALFSTEMALANLWRSWGVEPDALVGHSLGEYSAACLGGVLSLEDAIRLVALRARLLEQLPRGAMLALALPEEEARCLCAQEANRGIDLAAINGPEHVVLSGPRQSIDALAERLQAQGLETRRLAIGAAGHSSMVEQILPEFQRVTDSLHTAEPRIPTVSNLSGDWLRNEQARDPGYWSRHLRGTVRFAQGLGKVLEELARPVLLELGPGRTLRTLAQQQDKASQSLCLGSLAPPRSDGGKPMPGPSEAVVSLGRMWLHGLPVDLSRLHGENHRRKLSLPAYPFAQQRHWQPPPRQVPMAEHSAVGSQRSARMEDWCFMPSWRRLPPSSNARPAPCCLVLGEQAPEDGDNASFGNELARRLERAGCSTVVVASVSGDGHPIVSGFNASEASRRADRVDQGEVYSRLLEDLSAAAPDSWHLVHLLSLDSLDLASLEPGAEHEHRPPDPAVQQAFLSLLPLARALEQLAPERRPCLHLVTAGSESVLGTERLAAWRSLVAGARCTLAQELPGLRSRSIDLSLAELRGEQRGSLCAQLASEILTGEDEQVLALRQNERWGRCFVPWPLPEDERAEPPAEAKLGEEIFDTEVVRAEPATYLITGGLGGVGMELARVLAQRPGAGLLLTGLRALPPSAASDPRGPQQGDSTPECEQDDERRERVEELRSLGAKVMVRRADAADRQAMAAVLEEAESRFGPLRGVVHAAALTDKTRFRTLATCQPAEVWAHFGPKIRGAEVLVALLRERRAEFCVLTSSLSTFVGGLGYAAYAAANHFLDVFARARTSQETTRWLSVNWEGWALHNSAVKRPGEQEQQHLALSAEQGRELFRRLLRRRLSGQVAVSTTELSNRVRHWSGSQAWLQSQTDEAAASTRGKAAATSSQTASAPDSPPELEGSARPDLDTPFRAPEGKLQSQIAELWQQLLGFATVGVHDDFFELGGHSLLATQVIARLHRLSGVRLSLHEFFQDPTVVGLALAVSAGQDQGELGPNPPGLEAELELDRL